MPIVAERTVYHLPTGDVTMSNRIRTYPYKVVYLDLHDFMNTPNGSNLPITTDIIRAKTADEARDIVRGKTSKTIAIASAGRYPERLGTSVVGVQHTPITSLTTKQFKSLDNEVRSGAAKVPHRISPKAFVASNPNSTIHTRPTPTYTPTTGWRPSSSWKTKGDPIGAPRTALKSTPMPLSSSPLDIGGFTVGYRRPGDPAAAPAPTVARPTPQPDIYTSTAVVADTVAGGSLVNGGGFNPSQKIDAGTVQAGSSPVALPSGFFQFVTNDGKTHDAVKVPYMAPSSAAVAVPVRTPVIQDGNTFAIDPFGAPPKDASVIARFNARVDGQTGFYKCSDGATYPKAAATDLLNALDALDTKKLFFDIEPSIPPSSCSCCTTEEVKARTAPWKFWLPLAVAIAGIIYGMTR